VAKTAAVTAAATTTVTAAAKAETEIDCEMMEMPKKMGKNHFKLRLS
jgi:hypothetical protein